MRTLLFILLNIVLFKAGLAQAIPSFSKFYAKDSYSVSNPSVIRDGDSIVLLPLTIRGRFQGHLYIKTDLSGNEAYRFTVSRPDTIYGGRYGCEAHRTSSGHFIFGGFIGTVAPINFYLFKLSNLLDTVFIKKITQDDCSFLADVVELSDKNYLLSGYHRLCTSTTDLSSNAVMIKTDTMGNIIWQKEEPHSGYSIFSYTAPVNDGYYTSMRPGNGLTNYDSLVEVRKYDNDGNLRWILPLGLPGGNNFGGPLIATTDGGGMQFLNILDTSYSASGLNNPAVIYKFDSSGSIIWQKWLPGADCGSMAELHDGSFVFAESLYGLATGGPFASSLRGVLFKLRQDGAMLWQQPYNEGINTNYDAYFFDVTEGADHGIFATGQAVELASNIEKAWLVKVDSNGCLNGDSPTLYTDIKETDNHPQLLVFPNPASSQFTIAFSETSDFRRYGDIQLSLSDLSGRIIKEMPITQQATTFPREDISQGVYIYSLRGDGMNIGNGKIVFE